METSTHPAQLPAETPRVGLFHWVNLLYLVISVLSLLIAIRPAGKLPAWLDPGAAMMAAQVGLILIPALLFVWLTGQSPRTALKLHRLSLGSAAQCLLIGLCCWPLFQALTTLMQLVLALFGGSGSADSTNTALTDWSPWTALIGLALVAPLFEEVLFRGVLLSAYERRFGAHSIWLVGVLFAVFHFDLERILSALLVGLIAGWLVFRTRSLWSGVLVHFGANLVSGLLILLMLGVPADAAGEAQAAAAQAGDLVAQIWVGTLVWGGIGLILMLPVFFLLRSIGRRYPAPEEPKENGQVIATGATVQHVGGR